MAPKIQDLDALIKAMKEEFRIWKLEVTELLGVKDGEIAALRNEVRALEKRVVKLEECCDDGEAVSRRNQILISGSGVPAGTRDENPVTLVKNLFREKYPRLALFLRI